MKLLILSDTHGYVENARNIIQRIGKYMACVIHLGDHDKDAMRLQSEFSNIPFYVVRGNNDYGTDTPTELMVRYGGKKILLTHGNKQNVYGNLNVIHYWAMEKGADAVLFGHTHTPFYEDKGQVLLMNPGSISRPRQSLTPTFGILEITDTGIMQGTIMEYHGENSFFPSKYYL
ncbi:MAG: metallophosphoesterase [Epulopiscium sp.]|jgi:putative phosphoesterase|nr:metallophosphoesterase [Candidatus Epulonipiscium sp.]